MTEGQRAARQYRIEQWTVAIRDRAHSGQTVTAWCEENGVSQRVYYYRLRQVREYAARSLEMSDENASQPGQPALSAFTEVKLLELPVSPAIADAPNSGQLRIELGELQITADSGYPAAELAALLRELR
jgi:hypothetical protein